jgi:hypothetical protein
MKIKNPPNRRIFYLCLSLEACSSFFIAFKAINWSIGRWFERQLRDRGAAVSTFKVHVRDIEHLARRPLAKASVVRKGHKSFLKPRSF